MTARNTAVSAGWRLALLLAASLSAVMIGSFLLPIKVAHAEPVLPDGFISQTMLTGLLSPTAIAWAPDGRLFIAQQGGQVRVVQNGVLLPDAFIDISDQVNQHLDRGLLGIAVHPDFPTTPYVYLLFTYDPPDLPGALNAADGPNGDGQRVNRLIQVKADSDYSYNRAEAGFETILMGTNSTLANIGDPADSDGVGPTVSCDDSGTPVEDCLPSDSTSHTVGALLFAGPNRLYVSEGDAARFVVADPRALRAQDLDSPAGKLMCIDPGTGDGCPDNPFYDSLHPGSNRSRIYSYGLRNPFRFGLHPDSGEPYIGNVGWYSWEEINTGKGKNFGWPCYEGNSWGNARQSAYENDTLTGPACQTLYDLGASAAEPPLYSYEHEVISDTLQGAAVVAGAFYSGTTYPSEYQGAFFFADYNNNWMKILTFDAGGEATAHDFGEDMVDNGAPVHISLGPDGNLYYVALTYGGGEIRRIRYAGDNLPPTARIQAAPVSGGPPLTVSLDGGASSDPEGSALTYAWNLGAGITSTLAALTHTYSLSGQYTLALTVTDIFTDIFSGNIFTDSVPVYQKIVVGNTPPTAVITYPLTGATYSVGSVITLAGLGLDAEDGMLTHDENLQWEGLLHHNQHVHPGFFVVAGDTGQIAIPDHGDHNWLELCLTAGDNGIPGLAGVGGLENTRCVNLAPNRVMVTFDTDPTGLQLLYAGETYTTPFTIHTVVNAQRAVIAPAVQAEYDFLYWSDAGERSHTITISDTNQSLVATYGHRLWLPLLLRQ